MKNLFVSGYRSYELGVFKEEDEKIFFIKEYLKQRIINYIENGLEWVIITGQLGVELWVGEMIGELKEEYSNIKLGMLLPYTGFYENWNEKNRQLFEKAKLNADYVNYTSNKPYENPGQLKGNQEFVLKNTDGALIFYDPLNEGKPKYLLETIEQVQAYHEYELELISFDELQLFVTEYQETYFG